jgi:GTPase
MKTLAIVGRPNVGKSTLFNVLTRTKDALVYDEPGVTRDRQYGHADFNGSRYLLIDTGGIGLLPDESLAADVIKQSELAIEEADLILFMVDARAGVVSEDYLVAEKLRRSNKPLLLVVNKIDGINEDQACNDFYALGFSTLLGISASHRRNFQDLTDTITDICPSPFAEPQWAEEPEQEHEGYDPEAPIKVAIIGRPNAGKSTLINRLLGDDRVIVSPESGTTRDSIYVPFEHRSQAYILIDTAGVRRRSKVKECLEKFSVIKTLKAIDDCHVAIMMLNAQENVVDQDLHLLGYAIEAGKSIVIAVNKWDGLADYDRQRVESELERKLHFISYVKPKFISALHGTGVGELMPFIKQAHRGAFVTIQTSRLNEIMQDIFEAFPPPTVSGRSIKFRYAHIGGHNPPTFILHGARMSLLPESYQRYLMNTLRKVLKIHGTPIKIFCRD